MPEIAFTPPRIRHIKGHKRGFTLIEMSIVLVIIGLIVGGILVGRNLIEIAQTRALIAQIEKYKTSVNAFKGKYNNELPGDMSQVDAAQFGLWSGCTWAGCGIDAGDPSSHAVANNDGIIYMGYGGQTIGGVCAGECSMFWRHLSDARMVDGNFGADLNDHGSPQTQNSSGFYINSLGAGVD